jgi:hypothetical protein
MLLTTQIEIPEYGTMKKPSPNNASSLTPIRQTKKLPPTRKSISDKALATPPLQPKKAFSIKQICHDVEMPKDLP